MLCNKLSISPAHWLLVLLFWTSLTAAQLVPETAPEETIPQPQLQTLKTGWWGYFDPVAVGAEEKYAAFLEATRADLVKLSPQQRDEAERLLEAVENRLNTYRDLSTREQTSPDKMPPATDEYSVAQLVQLLEASRIAGRLVADEQLQLELSERQRDSDSRLRDQAFKKYIGEPPGSGRWLQGLRLAQARSQQAIAEIRVKLTKAENDNAVAYQQNLADRLVYARQRLVVPAEDEDVARAAKLVDDSLAAKLVAEEELEKTESKSGFDLGTEEGKAEQRIQQQRVLRARVTLAQRQIALAQHDAQFWLVRLYSDNPPSLSRLKEKELEWTTVNDNVAANSDVWKSGLEEEILLLQATPRGGLSKKASKLLDERLQIATGILTQLGELNESQQDLAFTLTLVDEVAGEKVSRIQRWLGVAYAQGLGASQWLGEASTTTLFEIGETPITGSDFLTVILIIVFAVILSKIVRKGLARVGDASDTGNRAGFYTFGRLFHYFIITTSLFVALASIGIDFSSLALVAGALGVGIGFGLQSIVNNFVSGLILLFENTLRIGDYIELDTGVTGTVKEINARSTLINTNDNIDIVVPNSEIASNKLTNWTLGEYILRMRIPFGVEYGSDKELVRKAAIEAANNVHFTLKNMKGRAPEVWLVEFGDSSLNFLLLVWVNRQGARRPTRTLANYLWELDEAFRKYGITVPFPQRDLHLRTEMDKFPAVDGNT